PARFLLATGNRRPTTIYAVLLRHRLAHPPFPPARPRRDLLRRLSLRAVAVPGAARRARIPPRAGLRAAGPLSRCAESVRLALLRPALSRRRLDWIDRLGGDGERSVRRGRALAAAMGDLSVDR